jgi:hypothetical protein
MINAENTFEEKIIETCQRLAEMLIIKNRKYGDSYRKSRAECEKKYGSRKIPFDFHANEKLLRYLVNNTDCEDSILDLAGYSILEVVCKLLDDKEG